MIDLYTTTGLAAIGTAIAVGWRNVKAVFSYISGILLLQKEIKSGDLSHALTTYLRLNYKRPPSGISIYYMLSEFVDNNRKYHSGIPIEMPPLLSIWWGKRGIFFVSIGTTSKIISLRYFSDPQGLICDSLDFIDSINESNFSNQSRNNFYVEKIMGSAGDVQRQYGGSTELNHVGNEYRNSSLSTSSSSPQPEYLIYPIRELDISFRYDKSRYTKSSISDDALKGLFYPDNVMKLIEDIKQWYAMRDWYEKNNVPWKMGVGLYGPGGTGKSRLTAATAQMIGRPLYQYVLSTLTDKEFINRWNNMSLPCVVALEDFDTVFNGRENITAHKSLSFNTVLNQISGIDSPNGILLIITTNNIDAIDPALGRLDENGRPTRPGRIDRIIEMGATDENQRTQIATHLLSWKPELIPELVKSGDGMTAAQFQAICIETSLANVKEINQ